MPETRLTGQCLCGAVAYAVPDEFAYAGNCHCQDCRRATGSAFKPFAGIAPAKFTLTRGQDNLTRFGDDLNHSVNCATCGSPVYSLVSDGATIHIALGTLAEAPSIAPSFHIFVGSKAPWFTITDSLPQYQRHVPGAD